MRCRRARRLVQGVLDGDVRESVAAELRAHLDGCAGCRAEYEGSRAVDAALCEEAMVDPPAEMARAISRRAAARHLLTKGLFIPSWLEVVTLGGVAVALGAVGFVGVSILAASFEVALSPAVTASGVAVVVATGLAAFGSSFYRAEI